MEIEGIGAGKDFKLYPGGGRDWDWDRDRDQARTRRPARRRGRTPDLRRHGCRAALGMNRRLQVDQRTLDYLAERSIAAHVAETREAVKIYNDLAEAAPVAGLFHSTC